MNSRSISSTTLPRMRFTKEDVQHYHEISHACLTEVLEKERSTSDVDLSDQSLSSSSGVAYHTRHELSAAVETVSGAIVSGPGAALAAGTKIPVMICTATMPGTLEDAMYGSYVDDAATFRRRSAYEQDLADDIGMGTFNRPTEKDPFQFMGLSGSYAASLDLRPPRFLAVATHRTLQDVTGRTHWAYHHPVRPASRSTELSQYDII